MHSFAPVSIGQPYRGVNKFNPYLRMYQARYVSNGDLNDMFYFIGTAYGAQAWTNPTPVKISGLFSSTNAGSPTDLTNRAYAVDDPGTGNTANSYMVFDLAGANSNNLRAQVLKYSLKNRASDGTRSPRNWKLQGTNSVATWDVTGVNAATWVDIDVRVADTTMPTTAGVWATYTVASTPAAYRYLRILQNGVNAAGDNFLLINEMQFYGNLFYNL